jgi:hypothetical protein
VKFILRLISDGGRTEESNGWYNGSKMKAPFPWFGGKSRVAHLVWDRFGDVPNYVEPFAGSLAVLLARPHEPGVETVNDKDCFIANFWRAVQANPSVVASWADWPVNEADLHARHRWLMDQPDFVERINTDPEFYDSRIAGWWVWGMGASIQGNWMATKGLNARPQLGPPRGINSQWAQDLPAVFNAICQRLRRVRILCGDWQRTVSSIPSRMGTTAVFLDPPYSDGADRSTGCYVVDSFDVAHDAREWALANGSDPMFRIALCGYEGEHEIPSDWECVQWKAGGMDRLGDAQGRENAARERIWFSPHCLRQQASLFDAA